MGFIQKYGAVLNVLCHKSDCDAVALGKEEKRSFHTASSGRKSAVQEEKTTGQLNKLMVRMDRIRGWT